jgi:hypothetical protein
VDRREEIRGKVVLIRGVADSPLAVSRLRAQEVAREVVRMEDLVEDQEDRPMGMGVAVAVHRPLLRPVGVAPGLMTVHGIIGISTTLVVSCGIFRRLRLELPSIRVKGGSRSWIGS